MKKEKIFTKKSFVAMMAAVTVMISLVGCGKNAPAEKEEPSQEIVAEETVVTPFLDDVEKYDSVISQLNAGQSYAFAAISEENDVLLVTDGVYEYEEGLKAAINATLYTLDEQGEVVELGKVFSEGTAYPLAVYEDCLMFGGNHHMGMIFVKDGNVVTKMDADEVFDESGNATYYYFGYEEHFEGEVEDNTKLTEMFDLYAKATVLSFQESEYAHIPGKYVHDFTEEMCGEMMNFQDVIVMNPDFTAEVTFQDTIEGKWNETTICTNDGSEYEYTLEGDELLLHMNDQWISFMREDSDEEAYAGEELGEDCELMDYPNNAFEDRIGKTSFDSYEEIIGLLEGDEAYAYVNIYGYDGKVLLVTSYTFDDLLGHIATNECTVYSMKLDGVCSADNNLFSDGTSNPIAIDSEGYLYAVTHASVEKYAFGDNGTENPALMVMGYVYVEEFGDNAEPKIVDGFVRTKNSLIEDDSVSLQEDDVDGYKKLRAEYDNAEVVSFTKADS